MSKKSLLRSMGEKSKYDMGDDAYDCTKENVLVNIEPTSPHHQSDGVHKD